MNGSITRDRGPTPVVEKAKHAGPLQQAIAQLFNRHARLGTAVWAEQEDFFPP